ncbi:hypothetical protein TESG_01470 [Trichophyton tonsurans CBS 112818]|uniref:Uncharacterized protein n=1 Tax=Trichophyton tonsurans (strain CBS 112818) TaxID=647933 RepID=F2RRN2_TRIT1|nr:hypothetical protein TESG_01470 [Trichophyton tonsurans CBS 112818]
MDGLLHLPARRQQHREGGFQEGVSSMQGFSSGWVSLPPTSPGRESPTARPATHTSNSSNHSNNSCCCCNELHPSDPTQPCRPPPVRSSGIAWLCHPLKDRFLQSKHTRHPQQPAQPVQQPKKKADRAASRRKRVYIYFDFSPLHLKDVTSLRTYNLHILPCKQQQQEQDRGKEGPSYLVAVKICSFRVAFDLRSNHGQVETLFVFG